MELNKSQQQAVNHLNGPILLMAGAGSGKTRTVIERINNMIVHGINPKNILAITFTNKAANELKSRLSSQAKDIEACTIHSLCVKILRKYAKYIGYTKNFAILDTDDSRTILNYVKEDIINYIEQCKEMGEPYPYDYELTDKELKQLKPAHIQSLISRAKNDQISPSEYQEWAEENNYTYHPSIVADIYRNYNEYTAHENEMDFDDLLLNTYKLLTTIPNVLTNLQETYQYITVDEYQDTNVVQNKIIMLLADKYKNICVVGDPDQSIYMFRGAKVENIINFSSIYPNAVTINLDQNYRSHQPILDVANDIINNNPKINNKTRYLHTTTKFNPTLPTIIQNKTDWQEGNTIVTIIKNLHDNQHIAYKDIAILYRINRLNTIYQRALMRENIPYVVYNSINFYQRKEVKDVIAYLQLCVNPHTEIYLKRILNKPSRKIGTKTINALETYAQEHNMSLAESLAYHNQLKIPKAAHENIDRFLAIYTAISQLPQTTSVYTVTHKLLTDSKYLSTLEDNKDKDALDIIYAFLDDIQQFDNDSSSTTPIGNRINQYLQNIALLTSTDRTDENEDAVKLMTIHTSKGLEFPVVFLGGCEQAIIPGDDITPDKFEEERRMMYVGVTRAEEQLYMCYADTRNVFGEMVLNQPSQFLDEIKQDHVNHIVSHHLLI